MDFVDLSHDFVENMPLYPGNPAYACCPILSHAEHGVSVMSLSMSTHLGTHVDAPYHFYKDGRTIDKLPLSAFVGPAIVVNVTGKEPHNRIMWKDISSYEQKFRAGAKSGAVVLLYTGWSQYWGTQKYFDHPFLDREAAQHIMDAGIKLIGIDTLSPDETTLQAWKGLSRTTAFIMFVLGGGRVIAENLTNLSTIEKGDWVVSLVPPKLAGSDGSPIRAFAYKGVNGH